MNDLDRQRLANTLSALAQVGERLVEVRQNEDFLLQTAAKLIADARALIAGVERNHG